MIQSGFLNSKFTSLVLDISDCIEIPAYSDVFFITNS